METIWESKNYARESESDHLSGLHYLVSWKKYREEENTWEPTSAVQHLRKLISSFYKNHPDKPTATFSAINTTSLIAKLIVRPMVKPIEPSKQKRGWPANSTNNRAKKWAALDVNRVFGWIWVTSKFDILSRVARDCTWLLADRLQNFYFSSPVSLSHMASVFLLEFPLGQEVFHWRLFLL